VPDFERFDRLQQTKRHPGHLSGVVGAVPDRKAWHDHVSVADGLHFVHVAVDNNGVEARVQIIEQVYNLKIM